MEDLLEPILDDRKPKLETLSIQDGEEKGVALVSTRVKVIHRLLISILVAVLKIFPGGFFWQLFGFAVQDANAHPTSFAFATGTGDAFGVFCGQIGLSVVLKYVVPASWLVPSNEVGVEVSGAKCCLPYQRESLREACIVASGSFCSGTAWQPLVTTVYNANIPFTGGALVVGAVCGLCFFIGVTIASELFEFFAKRERGWPLPQVRDITLAIAVMGAAACFVGTDEHYEGNWLSVLVGERKGNSVGLDSFKAGFSTFLGYCAFQLLLAILIPWGWLWTDNDQMFSVGKA
eukprot:m.9245 g.9245  ORF g.9245 m.9245 type:complete len:290 (-) comp4030_c0_seq2:38-907(-)